MKKSKLQMALAATALTVAGAIGCGSDSPNGPDGYEDPKPSSSSQQGQQPLSSAVVSSSSQNEQHKDPSSSSVGGGTSSAQTNSSSSTGGNGTSSSSQNGHHNSSSSVGGGVPNDLKQFGMATVYKPYGTSPTAVIACVSTPQNCQNLGTAPAYSRHGTGIIGQGDTAWVGPINVNGGNKTFILSPQPTDGDLMICDGGVAFAADTDGVVAVHGNSPCIEPEL